jgi:hypothetical protein
MKSHMAMDLAAELHIFRSTVGSHLFVVDGSCIYDVESNAADHIE